MKKLFATLALVALTVPVFASQATTQTAPPKEEQHHATKKNKKQAKNKKSESAKPEATKAAGQK